MRNKPLDWLSEIKESAELECKLASGRDGQGAIPKDLWETYSAFANTHGGTVLLGIKEKTIDHFEIQGVVNAEKVIRDLFNNLNNPKQVNHNILTDQSVLVIEVDGKQIIQIEVPAANRHQKPIFLNGNPFGNTYRRLHDGDRKCSDENVRRMLAEQVEDERDGKVLDGFGWEDIELDSFRIYRQMLRDAKPSHIWLELDDFELLKKLRGWRKDRETGQEGLTLAGLLMFGRWDAIQDAVPHYLVDYQERPAAKTELRWIDRLVPDGSWSGNLFDFFRIVYRKLTDPASLKVPFKLAEGQRKDDTPVHEAIREALINTIVHADYSGRLSVLVVKRPDLLGFRNPGNMRIPPEQAFQGGESDCRNRIMHQIFLMIGLGERAGSGIPKIISGWDSQHWRRPALYQKDDPEQTLLELRMLELLPEGVMVQLHEMFGEKFSKINRIERLILATAAIEQVVSHARIMDVTSKHSHDITMALSGLVRNNFLAQSGHGRGSIYTLEGQGLPTPDEIFGKPILINHVIGVSHLSSENFSDDSENFSEYLENAKRDEFGRLITEQLNAPVIDKLDVLKPSFKVDLEEIASEPRSKKRVRPGVMNEILIQLCTGHYVTRNCLAELVARDPDALRQQYIKQLLDSQSLSQAFPQSPTDRRQAYIATGSI
jgi:predicted HTH transcriptional regulator